MVQATPPIRLRAGGDLGGAGTDGALVCSVLRDGASAHFFPSREDSSLCVSGFDPNLCKAFSPIASALKNQQLGRNLGWGGVDGGVGLGGG